jgi:hypothetical protein
MWIKYSLILSNKSQCTFVFAVLNIVTYSLHYILWHVVWGYVNVCLFSLFPWCVQVHDWAVHLHTPRKLQRHENINFRQLQVAMQIEQGEKANINTRPQKFAVFEWITTQTKKITTTRHKILLVFWYKYGCTIWSIISHCKVFFRCCGFISLVCNNVAFHRYGTGTANCTDLHIM